MGPDVKLESRRAGRTWSSPLREPLVRSRFHFLIVLALMFAASTSAQDQNVYLFNIRANGLVDLLVPNRFADGDSRSWAGETRRFPNQDSGWWFVAPEPLGKHHLIAFLVPNGLKLDGLVRFDAGNPFAVVKARGQNALEQALKSRIPSGTTRADLEYLVVNP